MAPRFPAIVLVETDQHFPPIYYYGGLRTIGRGNCFQVLRHNLLKYEKERLKLAKVIWLKISDVCINSLTQFNFFVNIS